MSKEGYIQIKVRDLNEKVIKLENRIVKYREEIDNSKEEVSDLFEKQFIRMQPILDSETAIAKLNESFLNHIENIITEKTEKIRKEVMYRINNIEKSNIKHLHEWIRKWNDKLQPKGE